MAKSRVLIVGTGGIGTVAAYSLENGGKAEVTVVMRSNYQAAVQDGIDLDSVQYGKVKAWKPTAIVNAVPDVAKEGIAPFDYIVVTTKNIPDLPPTLSQIIAPAVTPGKTAIVLSQNGINIENPVISSFPNNPVISSVAYTGATETALAKVFHDDDDCQKIGAYVSPQVPVAVSEAAARTYVEIYNPTGKLEVIYSPEVAKARWRKIAYNASMNPVATIMRMDTRRLRQSEHIFQDLVKPIILEVRDIASAIGVELQPDLVDAVMHQDANDIEFKPSMCQDFEKGNLMEIENIIGETVREAATHGVPAPTLNFVYKVMKGLQLRVKEQKGLWEPRFEPGNPFV